MTCNFEHIIIHTWSLREVEKNIAEIITSQLLNTPKSKKAVSNIEPMSGENAEIIKTISNYHKGFTENTPNLVRNSLGHHYYLSNGAFSDNVTDWQSHMFLSGDQLDNWISFMIKEAGPHVNSFVVLNSSIRGDSALVVTLDTGNNKFRSWENETTVWQVGKIQEEWKIVGYYVRDLKNPE